jgi:hypothetical protein
MIRPSLDQLILKISGFIPLGLELVLVLKFKLIPSNYNPKDMSLVQKKASEKTNRQARLTLERSNLDGEVLREGFRQSSCRYRYQRGRGFKRILAVAVLELEGGERLIEVLVLPQQLFEDLFPRFQQALCK